MKQLICIALLAVVGCSDDTTYEEVGEGDASDTAADAPDTPDTPDLPDADATPDTPAPDNPLPLDESFVATTCADFCAFFESDCGLPPELGDSADQCEARCAQRLAEDGNWLVNYSCMEQSCRYDACFGTGAPEEIQTVCVETCARLDACAFLPFLDIPEGRPDICEALCSGTVVGNPGAAAAIECIGDGIADECEFAAVQACVGDGPGGPSCGQVCAALFLPDDELFCAEDSTLRETWPAAGDCATTCQDYTPAQVITLFGCLAAADCGDPTGCSEIPADPDANCAAACDAAIALCGPIGNLPDAVSCGQFCTGALLGFGVAQTDPGAAACVETSGLCAVGEDEQITSLLGCTITLSDTCATVCGRLSTCDTDGGIARGCPFGCTAAERDTPELVTQVANCVRAAADDCDAVLACVPAD